MIGMKRKIVAMILALMLLLLACCGSPEEPARTDAPVRYDWMAGESPVPDLRLGIQSQGISTLCNGIEVTESGVYCLYDGTSSIKYLMYSDHGSDTFVKVCGRPDCTHTDNTCNAAFSGGTNVCYYEGHLYIASQNASASKVYRVDLDGGNRVMVVDTADSLNGYAGNGGVVIASGICFFTMMTKLDGEGQYREINFYYKLDGSMSQPEPLPEGMKFLQNDGENLLLYGPGKREDANRDLIGRYLWDPDTNEATYLADQPEYLLGYTAVDATYYVDEGTVYKLNHTDGTTEALLDTGLDGGHRLHGFPDCFVISDYMLWWEEGWENQLEGQTLRFYNWDFEYLGEVVIDYPVTTYFEDIICGETAERILLDANHTGVPEYYIEKSDLGTGNIEIHKFNLPDVEDEIEEKFEEEAEREADFRGE